MTIIFPYKGFIWCFRSTYYFCRLVCSFYYLFYYLSYLNENYFLVSFLAFYYLKYLRCQFSFFSHLVTPFVVKYSTSSFVGFCGSEVLKTMLSLGAWVVEMMLIWFCLHFTYGCIGFTGLTWVCLFMAHELELWFPRPEEIFNLSPIPTLWGALS